MIFPHGVIFGRFLLFRFVNKEGRKFNGVVIN